MNPDDAVRLFKVVLLFGIGQLSLWVFVIHLACRLRDLEGRPPKWRR